MLSHRRGRRQQLCSMKMTAPAWNRALENNHGYHPLDSGCLLKPPRTPSRAHLKQAIQLTKHLRWFLHFFPATRGRGAGLWAWMRRHSTGLCVRPGCPLPAGTGWEAAVHPGQVPSPTHTSSHTCTTLESPDRHTDNMSSSPQKTKGSSEQRQAVRGPKLLQRWPNWGEDRPDRQSLLSQHLANETLHSTPQRW